MTSKTFPSDYTGRPFSDEVNKGGAQIIPGRIECAYYDLGGEGVAYHANHPLNHGSGEYNLQPGHQRAHATPYHWHFRREESIDISYAKDFLDYTGNNRFAPPSNQLYIGWAEDNEWCNYSVDVKTAGTYRIIALYSHEASKIVFSVNHQKAAECQLPAETGDWHNWNKAPIGTITFASSGLQLLTLHYNSGNNFAYFEFEPV